MNNRPALTGTGTFGKLIIDLYFMVWPLTVDYISMIYMCYTYCNKNLHSNKKKLKGSMAKQMTMIRLDENLKKELKKLAESENRSLSNFIINAVLEYIKNHYGKDIKASKLKK